jgi:MFS family permease
MFLYYDSALNKYGLLRQQHKHFYLANHNILLQNILQSFSVDGEQIFHISMQNAHSTYALNAITWLLSSVFYAFQMTLRVLPVVMIDFLSRRVGFNAGELGLLAGIYYVGYSMAHIPIGICLDNYSSRYTIFACILLCVLGLYLTAFAEGLWEIFISRFIIGVGSVAGILGAAKIVVDFYPKNYGLMLGLTVTIGVCGAYYGAQPIRGMLVSLSPEQVMQGLGLFGIILAASIWALYVAKPKNIGQEKKKLGIKATINFAMKNRNFWIMGFFGGLMVGPLEGFADLWGIKYLTQIHGLNNSEAAFSITLIFIGLGIGAPILGLITKIIIDLRKVIIFSGIMLLILLLVLFSGFELGAVLIYAICLFVGIFSAYQIIVFSLATNLATAEIVSAATAIVNMTIMIFGFIYHAVIGYILNIFFVSSGTDMLVYTNYAYQCSFAVILLGIILGIVGFYKMRITVNEQ